MYEMGGVPQPERHILLLSHLRDAVIVLFLTQNTAFGQNMRNSSVQGFVFKPKRKTKIRLTGVLFAKTSCPRFLLAHGIQRVEGLEKSLGIYNIT